MVWPPSFAKARAYLDQLERGNGLATDENERGAQGNGNRRNTARQPRRARSSGSRRNSETTCSAAADQPEMRMLSPPSTSSRPLADIVTGAAPASPSGACASRPSAIATTRTLGRGAARGVRRGRHPARHRRRVLLGRHASAATTSGSIARALSTWPGDRSRITVATKGGMTRPDGRWETDGRAKHLTAACEHSRRALGVERIDLYQLHAPDPRSAAGDERPRAGRVETRRRDRRDRPLQRDRRSDRGGAPDHRDRLDSGRAERLARCEHPQRRRRVLRQERIDAPRLPAARRAAIAAAHRGRSGAEARSRRGTAQPPSRSRWPGSAICRRSIVPIPGVTRVETAQSIARARLIALTDEDRRALDERFPSGRAAARRARRERSDRRFARMPRSSSSWVCRAPARARWPQGLVAEGYPRLNRDEAGGRLRDLLPELDRAIASGATRIVLDNTYVSRKSRAEVVQAASRRGVPVRCVWLSTSVEDAQVNAAWRLVSRYGRLPGDDELAALAKTGRRGVSARRCSSAISASSSRRMQPKGSRASTSFRSSDGSIRHVNRAVIVWCDGILLRSRSGARTPVDPDDVVVAEERAPRSCGDIATRAGACSACRGSRRSPTALARSPKCSAVFARLNERLGFAIDVDYCPHGAGPPRCWCRKPLPGLGVLLIHRHRLDPAQCIYVGAGAAGSRLCPKARIHLP